MIWELLVAGVLGPGALHARVLARRHPAKLWLLPLPLAALGVAIIALIDGTARGAAGLLTGAHQPPRPAVQLLLALVCAALTVPQRRCVRLGAPLVSCCAGALVLHLQYATAVALTTYPRPVALLCVGLPNLILAVHVTGLCLLHVGVGWWWTHVARDSPPPLSVRPMLWTVFTLWGPLLLVPQALVPLLVCPMQRPHGQCLTDWLGGLRA